ncbi:MAG: hypothetical protein ABEH40_02570 [Haloferacaceae archaeon]
MDSESPLAVGIAGQERCDTGVQFTPNGGAFESGFEFGFGFGRGRTAVDARRRLPGSRPHRRRADGDGR